MTVCANSSPSCKSSVLNSPFLLTPKASTASVCLQKLPAATLCDVPHWNNRLQLSTASLTMPFTNGFCISRNPGRNIFIACFDIKILSHKKKRKNTFEAGRERSCLCFLSPKKVTKERLFLGNSSAYAIICL